MNSIDSFCLSKESSSEALDDPVPFQVYLSATLVSSCLINSFIKVFAA
jgi:hypothetical protein